jgi:4-amino-4-deoxy-L-arabinose transferase-like glycosyltransferase
MRPMQTRDSNTQPAITKQHTPAVIILIVFTVICLIPFVNKAFHIDDPLFLWNARQIQAHPGDFYDFSTNWYGIEMPMYQVTKNPPIASYYIAAVASLFGWSEAVLHLAFFIPAIGVVLGIYFLAIRFCSQPVIAAFAGILTPVFLVSSTNVMCDTMMLAFWVWAIVLWMDGLEKNKPFTLLFSSIIISICALTKYFGLSLIPLLIIYSLFKKRGLGQWALFMFIPIIILAGYQWATNALYGRGLLLDAASYATNVKLQKGAKLIEQGLTGLAFSGGGIAITLFYLPLLWSKKVQLIIILLTAVSIFLFPHMEIISKFPFVHEGDVRWGLIAQFGIFALTGVSLLVLPILDLRRNKDADSLLLFLWIFGTFIFASFINWTINSRSVLPMIPAAAILLMRRIEQRGMFLQGRKIWCTYFPLIPAAILSLLVTWADYNFSDTARRAASEINNNYGNKPINRWFQGHWGFQYYMELGGGKAVDMRKFRFYRGDIMVIPSNNTNLFYVPEQYINLVQTITLPSFPWLATMNSTVGAGFYADIWGPLPFAIGKVPPEKYDVFLLEVSR